MTIKARFRMSVGDVYLYFDDSTLKIISVENPELIGKLFRVWGGISKGIDYIEKAEDGSLWVKLDLEDGYYGQPEYLLEVSS